MGYLCNTDDFVHILGDFEVIFGKIFNVIYKNVSWV